MIYVSHDAAEMERIAARVVRVEDGRVMATGGVELLSQDVMPRDPSSPKGVDGLMHDPSEA